MVYVFLIPSKFQSESYIEPQERGNPAEKRKSLSNFQIVKSVLRPARKTGFSSQSSRLTFVSVFSKYIDFVIEPDLTPEKADTSK